MTIKINISNKTSNNLDKYRDRIIKKQNNRTNLHKYRNRYRSFSKEHLKIKVGRYLARLRLEKDL